MKFKITAICILLIFATISLCGCEEQIFDTLDSGGSDSQDYINVTVTATAEFKEMTKCSPTEFKGVPNLEIEIKMDKDGGVNTIYYGTTGYYGTTSPYSYSFNVYKEQPINVFANLYSEVPEHLHNYSISSDYIQYDWSFIESQAVDGYLGIRAKLLLTATLPDCDYS